MPTAEPLVVPGVCRFTMHYAYTGISRPMANLVDIHIDELSLLTDRHDAIVDQATILANEWNNTLGEHLVDDLKITEVSWVDLNTEDGETGSHAITSGNTGGEAGAPASPQVCILVKKIVGGSRGTRTGRMFLPGVPEGNVSAIGVVDTSIYQPDVDDWRSAVEQDAGMTEPAYDSRIVVVHTKVDVDTGERTSSYSTITELLVETLAATQRHRLRP